MGSLRTGRLVPWPSYATPPMLPCLHWGTDSERVADTLAWFPTRVKMPTMSSLDLALAAARDLLKALQHPSPGSPLAPTTDSQTAALKQLMEIFQDCTQCSPLLDASTTTMSTNEVLEISQQQQTTQPPTAIDLCCIPATSATSVPPGFVPDPTNAPEEQPTVPQPVALPRVPLLTPTASSPRVHVQDPPPLKPTYQNTAIGSTRRRLSRKARTKKSRATVPATVQTPSPNNVTPPAAPTHVANSAHVEAALKV
jgi:hypothetical protein